MQRSPEYREVSNIKIQEKGDLDGSIFGYLRISPEFFRPIISRMDEKASLT